MSKKIEKKIKWEVYEDASLTSLKSTFSPSILSPTYRQTIPIGREMYHGTPKPAGMYPTAIVIAATNIA